MSPGPTKLIVVPTREALEELAATGLLEALDGPSSAWAVPADLGGTEIEERSGSVMRVPGASERAAVYAGIRRRVLFSRRARSRTLRDDPALAPPLSVDLSFRRRPLRGVALDGRLRLRVNRPTPHAIVSAAPARSALAAWGLRRAGGNVELERRMSELRPTVVVVPFAGPGDLATDAILAARRQGVPSLLTVLLWNGAGTRDPLWMRPAEEATAIAPDHLAVWGRHAVEHFTRVHGFAAERVSALGAPRFASRAAVGAPAGEDRPYVAFLGTAPPFADLPALRTLDAAIEERGLDARVAYRPHPDAVAGAGDPGLRHVVLRPPSVDQPAAASGDDPFIAGADLVVTAPSLSVVTAARLGRRQVLLAYSDGATEPPTTDYSHLQGIDKIEGIELCRRAQDLAPLLEQSLSLAGEPPAMALEEQIAHWVEPAERPYGEALDALAEAVARRGPHPRTLVAASPA